MKGKEEREGGRCEGDKEGEKVRKWSEKERNGRKGRRNG